MLAIQLEREDNILFDITPIQHVLIYWKYLNKTAYLEHFKYNKESNQITFDAFVSNNIYCFSLTYPTAENEYCYLSSLNNKPDDIQIQIIEAYNAYAVAFDNTNFLNFAKQKNVLEYTTTGCILAQSFNHINDACLANDDPDSDSDPESDSESGPSSDYAKYMNCLNNNTPGSTIIPDILRDPSHDLFNTRDEFIDDYIIDSKIIIQTTLRHIETLRICNNINLCKEIGMTDIGRITQIMNMVNKIDRSLPCCNYIQYGSNIAFELEIPLINFKLLPDITMYMKFNSLTFPYSAASVTFDVVFEENLGYIINYLIKKCYNWSETHLHSNDYEHEMPILSIIKQIHRIINNHGSIEPYTSDAIALINAVNELSVHTHITPINITEFSDYFKIIQIECAQSEAPISDETSEWNVAQNITNSAILCGKLMLDIKNKNIVTVSRVIPNIVKNSCIIPMMEQILSEIDITTIFDTEVDLANKCEIINLFRIVINTYPTLLSKNIEIIISQMLICYESCDNKTKNPKLKIEFDNFFEEFTGIKH